MKKTLCTSIIALLLCACLLAGCGSAAPAAPAQTEEKKQVERAILFISATCPNCKIAMNFMDKQGFRYRKLLATENADLAKSYGVKQAPTLVLPDGTKYAGTGAIKAYVSKIA